MSHPVRLTSLALFFIITLFISTTSNTAASTPATTVVSTYTVTTTADSGAGSLRNAILAANGHPGFDAIKFNISGSGVHTITPASPLPAITDPVIINGYTQSGASMNTLGFGDNAVLKIQLDGRNAGTSYGLDLMAGGSTVEGLVLNHFTVAILLSSNNNIVKGNFIGTNSAGNAAPGNGEGVVIFSASGNIVGGTAKSARNLISGNSDGIFLDTSATSNLIEGNLIGTQANGTSALGNKQHGVNVTANGNTIGGSAAGAGNRIAFNTLNGVNVVCCATGNSILGNAIYSNKKLGIDLNNDGVTANDASDPDPGANNLQNYPVLNSAHVTTTSTTVNGTLNSAPLTTFHLEFFSSIGCDPTGFGEGQRMLGTKVVTTDFSGNAAFTFSSSVVVLTGREITATATDPNNNTSEFSHCVITQ